MGIGPGVSRLQAAQTKVDAVRERGPGMASGASLHELGGAIAPPARLRTSIWWSTRYPPDGLDADLTIAAESCTWTVKLASVTCRRCLEVALDYFEWRAQRVRNVMTDQIAVGSRSGGSA